MQDSCALKPAKRSSWAPHGQHGFSLGPAMHHYRCQKFYISATASELIVDTLEFFPHNLPMPQLSYTDRLIMTANNMANSLKHTHPEVHFAHVGDDTITALTQLVEIFKNKFQKPKSPELTHSPTKAVENKKLAALTKPILTSTMHDKYQTRSQRPILNDGSGSISEGAGANTKSFSQKFVTR
jgi:hypothetical protein